MRALLNEPSVSENAIVILAAGNSSRLGESKQLLCSADGLNLMNKTIKHAFESRFGKVFIVLGSNFEKHKKAVYTNEPIYIVENKNWQNGMGSSLKSGLNAVLNLMPNVQSIIISVCDQIYLTPKEFNTLNNQYKLSGAPIVASKYDKDGFGVPVLFDKSQIEGLMALDDNHGALNYIKQHITHTAFINFDKGNIDIDTPQDVANYLS